MFRRFFRSVPWFTRIRFLPSSFLLTSSSKLAIMTLGYFFLLHYWSFHFLSLQQRFVFFILSLDPLRLVGVFYECGNYFIMELLILAVPKSAIKLINNAITKRCTLFRNRLAHDYKSGTIGGVLEWGEAIFSVLHRDRSCAQR